MHLVPCKYRYFNKVITLGDVFEVRRDSSYSIRISICKFIKVTRKGFNFLDLTTNRTILTKRHIYATKMAGKKYPSSGVIRAKFQIPIYLHIKKIKCLEEKKA